MIAAPTTEVTSHSKLASAGKTSETAVIRTAIKESNSRIFSRIKWKIHDSMSAISLESRPLYSFRSLRLKFLPVTRVFYRL